LALLLAKPSRRPLRDLVAELHKKHGGDYMRVKFHNVQVICMSHLPLVTAVPKKKLSDRLA
jgi:hypothetical protein